MCLRRGASLPCSFMEDNNQVQEQAHNTSSHQHHHPVLDHHPPHHLGEEEPRLHPLLYQTALVPQPDPVPNPLLIISPIQMHQSQVPPIPSAPQLNSNDSTIAAATPRGLPATAITPQPAPTPTCPVTAQPPEVAHSSSSATATPSSSAPPPPSLLESPSSQRSASNSQTSMFQIFDRRINFNHFPVEASLYSMLRAWVQDDPFRSSPPSEPKPTPESNLPPPAPESAITLLRLQPKKKPSTDPNFLNSLPNVKPETLLELACAYLKQVRKGYQKTRARRYLRFKARLNMVGIPAVPSLDRALSSKDPLPDGDEGNHPPTVNGNNNKKKAKGNGSGSSGPGVTYI